MSVYEIEIEAALEQAAEAGDDRILASNPAVHLRARSTSSDRRVEDVRNTIRRFLELLPEDLSVRDLLEAL